MIIFQITSHILLIVAMFSTGITTWICVLRARSFLIGCYTVNDLLRAVANACLATTFAVLTLLFAFMIKTL